MVYIYEVWYLWQMPSSMNMLTSDNTCLKDAAQHYQVGMFRWIWPLCIGPAPTIPVSAVHQPSFPPHLQVLCMYLFHELPETARRNAIFEFARVLKPGGIVVLGDSCQLGDRPAQDQTMGTFGDFNGELQLGNSLAKVLSLSFLANCVV